MWNTKKCLSSSFPEYFVVQTHRNMDKGVSNKFFLRDLISRRKGRDLFLVVSVAFIMSLFFMSGCGQEPVKSDAIVVWHWMTDRQDAFEALSAKYKELTGKEVRFELYAPSEIYPSKIRAAVQTSTLPDIFGVLSESRHFASFIKAGAIANLSEYMEASDGKWKNSFFAKALSRSQFVEGNEYGVAPGFYGVPIDVMNIQMLYNKKLFKKAGLDPENPPKTWKEFIDAGEKLKAIGVQVLISGFGETWLMDCLAINFAWNILGKEDIIATIRGEIKYTDPKWLKVFGLFKTLHDEGLIATGAVTMVNKVAEQNFSNERAAIAFNGSWCVNVYHGMNPDLDYGVMLPPRITDENPSAIWGGDGSSFMVNAKSAKKDDAVEFLRWLTDVDQQVFLSEETRNLPSNKDSLGKIPPVLKQFVDDMDSVVHPSQLPVAEFSIVVEAFDKGLQSIIIGEKTPQEIAEEVQKIKERELKRARR